MAELVPLAQKQSNVRSTLEKMKGEMAKALPQHLTPDRMLRVAITACNKTPKLYDCTRESLLGAVMTCAQIGLEPDGALGYAHLIPYGNQCTLIFGYKGLLKLARNSGEISTIFAEVVRSKDTFSYQLGLNPDIKHVPTNDPDPGEVTHAYAVARLKDGGVQFAIMTRADIDAIRHKSRAGSSGPWVDHYNEMAKKTVLRRLCKLLPQSVELATAVHLDDVADTGGKQEFKDFVDIPGVVEEVSEVEVEEDVPTKEAPVSNVLQTGVKRS